ncbi:hypothetical protein ACH5RR_001044 [Cinchona calisaya]|uniref:malate dehydrogenase n=1 Tax=Cinchona calisaya TaxID=153742 RepID=A0ABD3B329_9GENT
MAIKQFAAMMDWMLLEPTRPKQMTSVAKYFEKFENWRKDMLDLKLELDELYFIEKFSMGLDWNIRLKLWEFRSPPKILFEAYLRANFEEAVMKKVEVEEGRTMGWDGLLTSLRTRLYWILGPEQLFKTCLVSSKLESPVKLYGRKDAIMDWFNLETSTEERQVQVAGFAGEKQLGQALEGADIVIIPTGAPRKTGVTRDDLININAGIFKPFSTAITKYCSHALVNMISNPMSLIVPIASEVF